jgi:hypothetical protein
MSIQLNDTKLNHAACIDKLFLKIFENSFIFIKNAQIMSFKPTKVAKIQRIKLKRMFNKAWVVFPFIQSCIVSFEKVEKVLKPPQKPVTNNSRCRSGSCPFIVKPTKIPMMKHATTFEIKVAKGKLLSNLLKIKEIA